MNEAQKRVALKVWQDVVQTFGLRGVDPDVLPADFELCEPVQRQAVTSERLRLTKREYLRHIRPVLSRYGLQASIAALVEEAEEAGLLVDDPADRFLQKMSDKLQEGGWL